MFTARYGLDLYVYLSLILVFKGLSVSIVCCHLVEDTIQLISLAITYISVPLVPRNVPICTLLQQY